MKNLTAYKAYKSKNLLLLSRKVNEKITELIKEREVIKSKKRSRKNIKMELKKIEKRDKGYTALTKKFLYEKLEARAFSRLSIRTYRSDSSAGVRLLEQRKNKFLYNYSGWANYSRSAHWYIDRTYFCGWDGESGWFQIQVPAAIKKIKEAEEWLKPAEVRKAKNVLRQGDVYIIETKKMGKHDLPWSHVLTPKKGKYYLVHEQHGNLYIPFKSFKIIRQKAGFGGTGD